jgi:hypothetical protein
MLRCGGGGGCCNECVRWWSRWWSWIVVLIIDLDRHAALSLSWVTSKSVPSASSS